MRLCPRPQRHRPLSLCLRPHGNQVFLQRLLQGSTLFSPDPALAVMLFSSPKFYCSNKILSLTALLSIPQIFVRPAAARKRADEMKALFAYADGDYLTLLNVYHAFTEVNDQSNFYFRPSDLTSAGSTGPSGKQPD